MPIAFSCPSCSVKVTAPDQAAGKRAKCPSCRTVVSVPSPSLRSDKAARLAMFRQSAVDQLRDIQDPDVVDTFPFIKIAPIPDSRCCNACNSRLGKLIPTRTCTVAMLPPFDDCENEEDGCRCSFIPVDKWAAK